MNQEYARKDSPVPAQRRGTPRAVRAFLDEHVAAVAPLSRESRLAFWDASTSGSEPAAKRAAQLSADVRKLYADGAAFRQVRGWLAGGATLDPLERRQLELLDHSYTANQLAPALIEELEERAQEIEHAFNTFRAEVAGVPLTDNEVRDILEHDGDTARRRAAWDGSKKIGALIEQRLRALAVRRNEAARSLGFADFYTMELTLQEIEPAVLERITADVLADTDAPYSAVKQHIDTALGSRLNRAPDTLEPWHYSDPFFQEPPPAGDVALDPLFAGTDVVALSRSYFRDIGLPVDDVIARSDLYERAGKDQHAFCIDIDHEGDVRVLCNVKDNARWMGTMLHELGHAVYDLYVPAELPYLLRGPAHTLTTEAVAMHFGALPRDVRWLHGAVTLESARGEELARALPASRARELLVFARWALVMIRFERAFYQDPERTDLNRVWWQMVTEIQGLRAPGDVDARHDWASKIHLAAAPVYYHNYLLGELYAAQLRARMERDALSGPAIGAFMRDAVFAPGATLQWHELVRRSTGEDLAPRYFAGALTTAA